MELVRISCGLIALSATSAVFVKDMKYLELTSKMLAMASAATCLSMMIYHAITM